MKSFNKFEEQLNRFFKLVTAAALFVQMIIVFAGVIARYVFNSSQPWIDEISTYLLVVITYLGGCVALRSDKMAGITFVREAFSPKIQKVLCIVSDLMIMVLMFAIAYYGFKLCSTPIVLKQKTPTLQIPVIVFYCFVPISGFLMELSTINRLVSHIRGTEIKMEEEGAFTE